MCVISRVAIVSGSLLGVFLLLGCQAIEQASVGFSHVVEPERGLPPGMRTVAILPAKIGPNTDPKWSDLCVTILQSLVNESRNRFGTDVTVTDRRDTQVTFDEADLAAAGMSTASSDGGRKLLEAQGVILSNINVKIEKHIGKQPTVSGLSLSGLGGHGYGSGSVDIETREVETITRTMTVQTEFKLVDTSNNQVWAHHSPRTYTTTDRTKVSPIFGSSQTEAELTPQDEIIASLVERAAKEFVSQLMLCRIDVDVRVVSSHNPSCIQGVKFLRGELYDDALVMFQAALADNPDDHRAAFGAGVACEASGRADEALRYYRIACAGKDSAKYRAARNRMKVYGSRIRG